MQLETESGLRTTALENNYIHSEEVTGIAIHTELVEVLLEGLIQGEIIDSGERK